MNDVISDYQKWKQQGDSLRAQAKQAMESRFHVLLTEAAQIAAEYRSDFGSPLKPPPPVTAFRYKALLKSKAKKKAGKRETAGTAVREVPQSQSSPAKPNPKITGLQKQLVTVKRKLDEARSNGKPTKPIEDRIYEIEDELRLCAHAS